MKDEILYNFITALRDLCDKYLQNEAPATELFPERAIAEATPSPVVKRKGPLHYTRKHRKGGRSGVARSDFRTALLRQGVNIPMCELKGLLDELHIDQWSEGREVRFPERYIKTLLSAIEERY